MAKAKFSQDTRLFVEDRAGGRCEYFKAPVIFSPHSFTIDHIIPPTAGGSHDINNLAYACYGCNRCCFGVESFCSGAHEEGTDRGEQASIF